MGDSIEDLCVCPLPDWQLESQFFSKTYVCRNIFFTYEINILSKHEKIQLGISKCKCIVNIFYRKLLQNEPCVKSDNETDGEKESHIPTHNTELTTSSKK